jgi:hypothetical protein
MNSNHFPPIRPSDMSFHIRRGDIVTLDGNRLQFKKRFPSGKHEFETLEDGEPVIFEGLDLLRKWIEGKFVLHGNGELHPLELT